MGITVGYISGFIALAVFVIRFVLPNIISLILVHVLRDEQSAVTWSVASKDLQNSAWPMILQSDAVASHSVKPVVKVLSLLRLLMLVLITVAAVITPLGLFSYTALSEDAKPVDFTYIGDMSNIGLGTESRPSNFNFSRVCGYVSISANCPGTSPVGRFTGLPPNFPPNLPLPPHIPTQPSYDSRIPNQLFRLFESGLAKQKTTVSSIFDIQWRLYKSFKIFSVDNNKPYPVGAYRQIDIHLPSRGVELVEGLVVDYNSAGIGFRNHTLPDDTAIDAEWDEDLLFLEPETSCVDTNLTFRFSVFGAKNVLSGLVSGIPNGGTYPHLVDRGGFANFKPAAPYPEYGDTQKDPKLALRAFNGGWLNNFETMVYMGIAKPTTHPWTSVKAKLNDPYLLANHSNPPDSFSIKTAVYNKYILEGLPQISGYYKNPYNLRKLNFTYPTTVCEGAGTLDSGDIKHIATKCGLVYGTPHGDEASDYRFQTIYSCASTTRAIIKTVRFRLKASPTRTLDSLQILSIHNKKYENTTDLPYWGVENTHLDLGTANPLWGLVDKDMATQAGPNISIVQSERLYLPGLPFVDTFLNPDSTEVPGALDNLPGANFYLAILNRMYDLHRTYSGYNNFGLAKRWAKLSETTNGTAEMMNLIWTDLAANAVMGSRGWVSTPRTFPHQSLSSVLQNEPSRSVAVHPYVSKVGYHWWYSIPAFLTLAVAGLLTLIGLACFVFGRARPKHIRFYLNRFSAGRLMTMSKGADVDMSTKEWIEAKGSQRVDIGALGVDKESIGDEVSVEANKPT